MTGLTIEEIAQRGAQMYQTLQNRPWQPAGAPVAPQAPSYGYQAPPAPPSAFQAPQVLDVPKPEDWLSNPSGAAERYAQYLQQTQIVPQMRAQAQQAAQTNRELVKLQRVDEFRRWGPEIEATLQQMAPDPTAWTPQNIGAVVDMVKARHVNELIAEERAKYTNELGGATVRPGGGAAPTSQMGANQVDFEKLPPGYKEALHAKGVNQRVIDEFLTRTYVHSNMEPDIDAARARWVQQVMKGDVFSDHVVVESPVHGGQYEFGRTLPK